MIHLLHASNQTMTSIMLRTFAVLMLIVHSTVLEAQTENQTWTYDADLMRPFWRGNIVTGESVLFIKDPKTGEARASVLYPIDQILVVRNSPGDIHYEEGRDYVWKPGSREIVLPPDSRITSSAPMDLRRPAGSQKYQLTHRDGRGEIFFGGRLEYADLQTCISYEHPRTQWNSPLPKFSDTVLPRSVFKLLNKQPLSMIVLGDSISAGANSSKLGKAAPYQPAFPELIKIHLTKRFASPHVNLINISIGGRDTAWGLTQVDNIVAAKPDLVILAFGMNDSAGRSVEEFKSNTKSTIDNIRAHLPESEFILVASMLGNRNWTRLHHESFPAYRDALRTLCDTGIALADLTSIWTQFLELKHDWDQTGNGVNHPNDFGHRVYAQVISTLLDPRGEPSALPEPPITIKAGPLKFSEQRLLSNYTYSYACAAADLDGDGDLDLTSSDAEPNSNLYLLLNNGAGQFTHSFIQKYQHHVDQPIRLERHAIGDINRDGRPDVVIVDNLKWDIRWFENPGNENIEQPWTLHRVAQPKEVPGSYDVALSDLDGDGDLDVAASSWRFGNRFDWFENVGEPGDGSEWIRHEIKDMVAETRTIACADFNRDGKPDILGTARVGNQTLWYENPGNPSISPWIEHVIDAATIAPAHGHPVDLDSDGDLDVIMAFGIAASVENTSPKSHQIAWYENIGTPGLGTRWKKHQIAPHFPQGFEAVTGDLDGDGDLDVVATGWSPHGRIAWFENSGNPTHEWTMHSIKQNWPNAVTLVVKDLDHDGRLDIAACAERGANEIRWWRNLGN